MKRTNSITLEKIIEAAVTAVVGIIITLLIINTTVSREIQANNLANLPATIRTVATLEDEVQLLRARLEDLKEKEGNHHLENKKHILSVEAKVSSLESLVEVNLKSTTTIYEALIKKYATDTGTFKN